MLSIRNIAFNFHTVVIQSRRHLLTLHNLTPLLNSASVKYPPPFILLQLNNIATTNPQYPQLLLKLRASKKLASHKNVRVTKPFAFKLISFPYFAFVAPSKR